MPANGATSQTALFVLAHHDDEVFCAGHLYRAVREGRTIRLLWATAGGLASPARRVAEGRSVCRLLELAPEAARDLRLPDQQAIRHVGEIVAAAAALIDGVDDRGVSVCVPAYEGGHPDHDAVNLAVAILRRQRPGIDACEFPLYRRAGLRLSVQSPHPAANTPAGELTLLHLDDAAMELRERLIRANASQRFISLAPLLALARRAGRGRAEPSRPLPAHDYTRPPHDGRLLYETYTRRRFPGWRDAAATQIDALG